MFHTLWQHPENDEHVSFLTQVKQYVHMLNATLVATERTMCCIVENYQNDKGIVVPDVLRPYMCGIEFIPFVNKPSSSSSSKSKEKKEATAAASAPKVIDCPPY